MCCTRWAGGCGGAKTSQLPPYHPSLRAHPHHQRKKLLSPLLSSPLLVLVLVLVFVLVLLVLVFLLACAYHHGRGTTEQTTTTTTKTLTPMTMAGGYSVPAPMVNGQPASKEGEQEPDHTEYPGAWSTPGHWSCLLWCGGGTELGSDCGQFLDVCGGAVLMGLSECVATFAGCLDACGRGFAGCCNGCVNCSGNCCDCAGDCSCC